MITAWRLAAILLLPGAPAVAQTSRPDPADTPGALNPAVTPGTVSATICAPGWARTVRPPRGFTSYLSAGSSRRGYPDQRMRDYEEDHLIPLSLGGAPADGRNLWPEPRPAAGGWVDGGAEGSA